MHESKSVDNQTSAALNTMVGRNVNKAMSLIQIISGLLDIFIDKSKIVASVPAILK